VSIGFHSLFDHVSSLLMRLSTSWHIAREFSQHFPTSTELQLFLSEYLIRVVQLCQKVVIFSRKSTPALLAASLFSSFDAEFSHPQQELDQWGLLIEKKFTSLIAKSTLDSQLAVAKTGRSLTRLVTNKSKQNLTIALQQKLIDRLSPEQNLFETTWRRERKRGNAPWVLNSAPYISWKANNAGSVLQVSGCLGSGKSVALANVAADLSLENKSSAFFFCKNDDRRTLTARSVLGSIAQQLLLRNIPQCRWIIFDKDQQLFLSPLTTEFVVEILQTLLPLNSAHWIVLDGLEHCPVEELQEIMDALANLGAVSGLEFSVCYSTKPDSETVATAASKLGTGNSIHLNNPERDGEIHDFIRMEVNRRNALRFQPLNPEVESAIIDQLCAGAQGMYLWVSLQIEAILPTQPGTITISEDVIDILGKLPRSLPEAFDQAISRILDKRYTQRIFDLVAAAVSPLSGEQIKVALAVTPGNKTWDNGKLPDMPPGRLVAASGGSLLEFDEEDGLVRFIHHSVLAYLAEPNMSDAPYHIKLRRAETYMGSICVTYLSYGAFDTRLSLCHQDVDVDEVARKVKQVAGSRNPFLAHIIRHLKNDKRRKTEQFNLLSAVQQIQVRGDDQVKCFLPYAQTHWMHHTRFFNADTSTEPGHTEVDYSLWKTLVEGTSGSEVAKPPWGGDMPDIVSLFDYASRSNHFAVFQYILRCRLDYRYMRNDDTEAFAVRLTQELSRGSFQVEPPWLDNILPLYLALTALSTNGDLSAEVRRQGLVSLANMGASGSAPLCRQRGDRYHPSLHDAMFSELCGIGPTVRVYQEAEMLKFVLESMASYDNETYRGCQDWFRSLLCRTITSGWEAGALAIIDSPPMQFKEVTLSPKVLTAAIKSEQPPVIRKLISKGVKPDGSTWDGVFWVGIKRMQRFLTRETARFPIPQNLSLPALIGSNDQALAKSEQKGTPEHTARVRFDLYVERDSQAFSLSTRSLRPGFQMHQLRGLVSNRRAIPEILMWVIEAECSGFLSGLAASLSDQYLRLVWEIGGSHFLPATICSYSLLHDNHRDEHGNSARTVILELISIASRLGLIDEYNPFGKTALHYAIEGRMLGVIDQLLKHGATPTLPTRDGLNLTPLELVIQQLSLPDAEVKRSNNGLLRIISMLTQHDAAPPHILESSITISDMAIVTRGMELEDWLLRSNDTPNTLSGDKVQMCPEMEALRSWQRIALLLHISAAFWIEEDHDLFDLEHVWSTYTTVEQYARLWMDLI